MVMHVGTARIILRLPESSSLKDKRQVVRSTTERIRNRFNVAIAEIETQDSWRTATLGLVCVSGDARHTQEMLDKVVSFIEEERLDAEVGDVETELIAL